MCGLSYLAFLPPAGGKKKVGVYICILLRACYIIYVFNYGGLMSKIQKFNDYLETSWYQPLLNEGSFFSTIFCLLKLFEPTPFPPASCG